MKKVMVLNNLVCYQANDNDTLIIEQDNTNQITVLFMDDLPSTILNEMGFKNNFDFIDESFACSLYASCEEYENDASYELEIIEAYKNFYVVKYALDEYYDAMSGNYIIPLSHMTESVMQVMTDYIRYNNKYALVFLSKSEGYDDDYWCLALRSNL